jgi:hypothetical protein
LALASGFTTKPSADSGVVFRAVAIWLTNMYLARSRIFPSSCREGLRVCVATEKPSPQRLKPC